MTEKPNEKIQQLQLIEQNLQNFAMQRQQFQGSLIEIESALTELKSTKKAFKIIGNIMVASEKDDITKDLSHKKEVLEIRIKNIEKQESQLKEKAKKLQEEVMKTLK